MNPKIVRNELCEIRNEASEGAKGPCPLQENFLHQWEERGSQKFTFCPPEILISPLQYFVHVTAPYEILINWDVKIENNTPREEIIKKLIILMWKISMEYVQIQFEISKFS